VVPRNQSRLIREVPLSDRSASASFRSTTSFKRYDKRYEEKFLKNIRPHQRPRDHEDMGVAPANYFALLGLSGKAIRSRKKYRN
jgi:hypothetical protein